tara:strand:- start:1353 stop:2279 length:927 start_codon:yes stop_codon:yes gene_type:complete
MGRLIIGEGFEVTITTTGSKMVVQDQDGGKLAISSSTMIFDSGSASETKMVNDGNKGIKFFPKGAVFPTVISSSGIIFEKGSSKERAMEAREDGIRMISGSGAGRTKLFKMKDDGTTETKGATSQSIVNFEGALSASGYVKCKNFFMGHNYGFAPYGIIAHSDIVPSETITGDAATKFVLAFHPNATNTMVNTGPNGSLSFMEGGTVKIKMDHDGGLQIGGPGSTSVATSKALKAGHKLEVEGHITSSGKLIIGATTQSSAEITVEGDISGSGTGSFGNLSLDNIPTSDPGVAGRLWRSGTDLKISIG